MNDSGKTIKSLLITKSGYRDTKKRGRCVVVEYHLQLADAVKPTDIYDFQRTIRFITQRCNEAIGNEFLP